MSTNRYQGVDPILTNVALGYSNDAYIADLLLPEIGVNFQTGKHWIYDQGRFRNTPSKRGTGAESGEVALSLTTGNPYFCEDHALKQFVPDEDVENATTPTDPYTDATENVTEQLLIAKEVEAASILTSTSVITQNTTLSGTSQFSDYSNSDPFTVIETGKQTIHNATHLAVNTMVIGKQAYDKLKYHPALLERVKYSQRGQMTPDLIASLFEVDRLVIGAAGYNTTKEGQTDSMSYIWGKDILLAYVAPRIAPKMLTLGLTYRWNKKSKTVKRLRGTKEDDRNGTYVRAGDDYYDQNVVAASCGYLIKSATA
jgi:hypothetical protein